jgi:hypothetical protein
MALNDIFLSILFIWTLVLSYFVFKTRSHYFNLISKTKKKNIDEILDSLMEKDKIFDEELDKTKKTIYELTEKEKVHYQKVGFLRFNPFDRVGGEQSFILAILNAEDSGIVLNYLYTREGVRVYAKRVNQGKSEEYALSAEELEAIKKSH